MVFKFRENTGKSVYLEALQNAIMLTGHTVITSEISLGAILSCIYICVGELKKVLEEAMKNGYVVLKLVKVIVVGPAGVGKTCLIYLLLGKDPPDKRSSTGCAEQSIRVIRIGKEGEEWSEISTKEFIAEAVPILYEDLKRKGKSMDELAEEIGLGKVGTQKRTGMGKKERKKERRKNHYLVWGKWAAMTVNLLKQHTEML